MIVRQSNLLIIRFLLTLVKMRLTDELFSHCIVIISVRTHGELLVNKRKSLCACAHGAC